MSNHYKEKTTAAFTFTLLSPAKKQFWLCSGVHRQNKEADKGQGTNDILDSIHFYCRSPVNWRCLRFPMRGSYLAAYPKKGHVVSTILRRLNTQETTSPIGTSRHDLLGTTHDPFSIYTDPSSSIAYCLPQNIPHTLPTSEQQPSLSQHSSYEIPPAYCIAAAQRNARRSPSVRQAGLVHDRCGRQQQVAAKSRRQLHSVRGKFLWPLGPVKEKEGCGNDQGGKPCQF